MKTQKKKIINKEYPKKVKTIINGAEVSYTLDLIR